MVISSKCSKVSSLILTLAVHACHSANGASPAKGILGPTSQLQATSDKHLQDTVGYLTTADGSKCTAFITGASEITTAAHCRGKSSDGGQINAKFQTVDGSSYTVTSVKTIDTKKDYLVLVVDASFTDTLALGSIGNGTISIVGYDFDKKALYSQDGCQAEQHIDGAGVFTHSCDSIPGFSGGAILQQGKVVGIHLGYQASLDRNAAFETAKLTDDSVDVSTIGIKDECLFDCHIRNVIPTPSAGAVVGAVLGGVVGAAVGALIGDHNLAQQKIKELRDQNNQQAADLLQAKIELDDAAAKSKVDHTALANANSCVSGVAAARGYFLGQIDGAYNTFNTCLQNAAAPQQGQLCLDTYEKFMNDQLNVSKIIANCPS